MIPQLDGLLLVDKPPGKTSHDIVDFVRRRFNQRKVGHCGTLDPIATGLLMLVVGRATRVQDLLMTEDKEYEGTLKLGESTDTQDAQGKVLETKPVPDLDRATIEAAFKKFTGEFEQIPPMVSAIKRDGVPLYKLAREGKTVDRPPRRVRIDKCEILEIALPCVRFRIHCTKGFYVRTYCHDLGNLLGCGGHMSALIRTRSGNFELLKAIRWADLETAEGVDYLARHLISLPEISRIRRT
ncbi:MAG: tRNA pseudouridine(55) synthase TruB [Verrucomicrobia bacterium]|nr:tRNA pseudouridine(55) synthase TruB [Verrucomicrobiota bacterium]